MLFETWVLHDFFFNVCGFGLLSSVKLWCRNADLGVLIAVFSFGWSP